MRGERDSFVTYDQDDDPMIQAIRAEIERPKRADLTDLLGR